MKRITLLIGLLFFVISCEIQYDGETKIVVTGRLLDQNDNPISNKDIEIDVLDGPGFLLPASDLISFGKSDQKGNFTLIFPAPRDGNRIRISINDIINSFDHYQSKNVIANIKNFENYKLNLDPITLYKNESITTLRLILNPISPNTQIKEVEIIGKQPNINIDLVQYPIQNINPIINTFYQVIKNQTVILKYKVVDYSNNGLTKVQSILIPIGNDAISYTITY